MRTMLDQRWVYGSALACVCLSCIYPWMLPRPLLDPDEGLHAVIAQDMAESGDYLTPRLQGEVFRDKPILYFAAQALSLRLFGMNEAAIRLPGYLFTLLGVATTWMLAHRLFGFIVGRFAMLISLTLAVPMAISQAGIHDIALVPWTNLLLLCLWETDQRHSTRSSRYVVAAAIACCALAILTKGLIGVAIVSVGSGGFVLLSKQHIVPRSLRLVAIVIAGLVLASPWFLHIEALDPGYLRYYFIERHVMGYATATQRHGDEPWFYYLPILVGGSMPWLLYAATGINSWNWSVRTESSTRRPVLFVVCWLVGGLVFLSIARSKLTTYALPLFPAIAILSGVGWQNYLQGRLSPLRQRLFRWSLTGSCFLGIVLPIAAVAFVGSAGLLSVPPGAWIVALLLGGLSAYMVALFRQLKFVPAIGVGAVWMSLLLATVMTWPGQIVAEQYSARSLGLWLSEQELLPDNLILTGDRVQSAIFYLAPEQRRVLRDDQIRRVHESETDDWNALPADTVIAMPNDLPQSGILQASLNHDVTTVSVGRFRIIRQTAVEPIVEEQEVIR